MKTSFKILIATIISFVLIGCISSCRSYKEIPVQTIEKIVYHDSLIYIKDSVIVQVPYEVIKNTTLPMDTSFLKTSLAESMAYIDTTNNKLQHTLTQKGNLKVLIDTVVEVQYVDRIVNRDVPVEVEVIKYKRDLLFWLLIGWAIFSLMYIAAKIYIKFKTKGINS